LASSVRIFDEVHGVCGTARVTLRRDNFGEFKEHLINVFSQYGEAGAIIVNDREMLTEPDWEASVNGGEERPFVWQPREGHMVTKRLRKHMTTLVSTTSLINPK
jgi:hypothetical protein